VNDVQAEEKHPAESIIPSRRNIEAAITNSGIETKEINDQKTNHSKQSNIQSILAGPMNEYPQPPENHPLSIFQNTMKHPCGPEFSTTINQFPNT
jgi:hypothetical protein